MIKLDWELSLEERLKFVREYVKDKDFNMASDYDKKILTLLSDYLVGEKAYKKETNVENIENLKNRKVGYISEKTLKRKYSKENIERKMNENPVLRDLISYRDSMRKLKKKNKNYIKDKLDALQKVSSERVSTEKEFFQSINADIGYLLYPQGKNKYSNAECYKEKEIAIDYTNKNHIKGILRNYDSLTNSSDLICIKNDIDKMLKNVSITKAELDNLVLFMSGELTTGIKRNLVDRVISKIVNYNCAKNEEH